MVAAPIASVRVSRMRCPPGVVCGLGNASADCYVSVSHPQFLHKLELVAPGLIAPLPSCPSDMPPRASAYVPRFCCLSLLKPSRRNTNAKGRKPAPCVPIPHLTRSSTNSLILQSEGGVQAHARSSQEGCGNQGVRITPLCPHCHV